MSQSSGDLICTMTSHGEGICGEAAGVCCTLEGRGSLMDAKA